MAAIFQDGCQISPRNAPAVAVKSGGAEGWRGWGLSVDSEEERSCSLITRNDTGRAESAKSDANEMD